MRLVRFDKARWMALLGSALVFAALVSVGLAVQGSASEQAKASGAKAEAGEVGARVARSDVVSKLEATLGDAFGGVWFDPSGIELHVGVTSPRDRQAAEAVAAVAGVGGDLTPTPVRWTWAQLQASQARWNDRLVGLLGRGEVSTSLAADLNAVQVELSSSVPASERAALERQAAEDSVAARVKVLPASRFGFEPWARCAKFVKFKAYCDPTLVSGVSIDNETEVAGEGDCTAGPLVINKAPANEAARTETFLLTAGHCITGEGAVGKKWYAIEKQGAPKGRKEIGKASAALTQEVGIGADVGVIPLEAAPWKEAKDPPLSPVLARWDAANETDPFPVIKEEAPVKNAKSCFSGQRSGTQCGKIIATKKVIPTLKGEWKEVFEIQLETGKGGQGDSGSPVFSEAPYKNNAEGHVEGIIVGGAAAESEFAYAQPLSFLLAELNKNKALNFELLRQANEKRHPGVGKFHTSLGYTTLTAGQTVAHNFTAGAGSPAITCGTATFSGLQVEKTSEKATVTPVYQNCKDSLGREADVITGGATYTFNSSGTVDVVKAIEIKVTNGAKVAICTVIIPVQTGINAISYANESATQVKVTANASNIKNTTSGGLLNCGIANGEHTAGTYQGTSVVSGESAGETATLRYE